VVDWTSASATPRSLWRRHSAPRGRTLAHRDELTARRDGLRETPGRRARPRVADDVQDRLAAHALTSLESQDEGRPPRHAGADPERHAWRPEAVRATEGFEAALDTLLRDVSKAIVVDSAATAADAIARLRERGAGRGAFIVCGRFSTRRWRRSGRLRRRTG